MALTRVQEHQVNTTVMGITDNITVLNQNASGANSYDIGFVFDRGLTISTALVWNESTKTFRFATTSSISATQNTITVVSNAPILSGQHYISNGNFTADGDAISATYVARNITTDANVHLLYLDGISQLVNLNSNNVWSFDITVAGLRTDANCSAAASFNFIGAIAQGNTGPTSTFMVNGYSKSVIAKTDSTWDVNLVANTTGGSLDIQVNGNVGQTVRWVAKIDAVEISLV